MIKKLSGTALRGDNESCAASLRELVEKINELIDIVNNHSCLNETFINSINALNGQRYEENKAIINRRNDKYKVVEETINIKW